MMNASLAESSGEAERDAIADSIETPDDAASLGVGDGAWAEVWSRTGSIRARARLSPDLRRGTAVMAHGFGSPLYDPATGGEVFCTGNERNKLVSASDLDPLAAVPRLNGTRIELIALPQGKG